MIDASLYASLASFDDTALATLTSPGLVRRAHRDVEEGGLHLASTSDGTAVIETDGQQVTLDAGGPGAARCTCRSAAICRHRIAAVLFLRRQGDKPAGELEKATVSGPRVIPVVPLTHAAAAPIEVDRAILERVAACLAEIVTLGFGNAPLAMEEALVELAVSSRAGGLIRLSALLRTITAQLRLQRQRALGFDPDRLLELTASTFALTRALKNPAPHRLTGLAGQARREFTSTPRLGLVGCGGERWRAPTGARGATAWFFEPDTGRWLSMTLARQAGRDPAFQPTNAWREQAIWQAEPLAILAHARIELEGVGSSADNRLSAPATARATIIARNIEADSTWPGVVREWHNLQPAWLERTGLGLDAIETPIACLLSPAAVAQPYFDDLAQQLVWPVQDVTGQWLALTLDHEEPGSAAIETTIGTVRHGWQGMLLARLVRVGETLQVQPITLFGPDGAIDLTFGRSSPTSSATRRTVTQPDGPALSRTNEDRRFARRPRGSTQAVLAAVWQLLLDRAEIGPAFAASFEKGVAKYAERLDGHGLPTLAVLLRQAKSPSTMLAAAYGSMVVRQQRCDAPLLQALAVP